MIKIGTLQSKENATCKAAEVSKNKTKAGLLPTGEAGTLPPHSAQSPKAMDLLRPPRVSSPPPHTGRPDTSETQATQRTGRDVSSAYLRGDLGLELGLSTSPSGRPVR